jgi:ribosomal protein S18 acetylase RimI-like enzyme
MEHMAEVRLLNQDDAQALWDLRLEALEREPRAFAETPEEHRRLPVGLHFATRLGELVPGNFVVGAFREGALAGMAGFRRSGYAKTHHKGSIWGVYLKSAARGKGLATKMLQALLDRASGLEGLTCVTLTVAEDNLKAIELYRRLGFREYGRDPCALRVDGVCVPELLMRRADDRVLSHAKPLPIAE